MGFGKVQVWFHQVADQPSLPKCQLVAEEGVAWRLTAPTTATLSIVPSLPPLASMPPRRSPRTSPRTSPKGKGKEISGSVGNNNNLNLPPAFWSDDDVTIMVDLVIERKAEAGDGLNFKTPFWNAVAAALSPPLRGGVKTVKICKDKWKRVRIFYLFVGFYNLVHS
jgi:hypothetical protein